MMVDASWSDSQTHTFNCTSVDCNRVLSDSFVCVGATLISLTICLSIYSIASICSGFVVQLVATFVQHLTRFRLTQHVVWSFCGFDIAECVQKLLFQGRYKRFDRFQEDVFEVFGYARKVSSVDSQVEHTDVYLLSILMTVLDIN